MAPTTTWNPLRASRLLAEADAEQHSERLASLEELHLAEKQLQEIAPPLRKDAEAAEKHLQQVIRENAERLKAAGTAVADARRVELAATWPIERVINLQRMRLESDLQHRSITQALEAVAETFEAHRAADETGRNKAVIQWCATATRKLQELRFSTSDNIAAEVETILDSCP